MTLLSDIVATSQRVSATAARLGKVRDLAACLRRLDPGEIAIGVRYLSGETRVKAFKQAVTWDPTNSTAFP